MFCYGKLKDTKEGEDFEKIIWGMLGMFVSQKIKGKNQVMFLVRIWCDLIELFKEDSRHTIQTQESSGPNSFVK